MLLRDEAVSVFVLLLLFVNSKEVTLFELMLLLLLVLVLVVDDEENFVVVVVDEDVDAGEVSDEGIFNNDGFLGKVCCPAAAAAA